MKAIWMRFGVAGALVCAPVTSRANVGSTATPLPGVVLYKSDLCGCCGKWADHLRAAGFRVTVRSVGSLTSVENRYGVPKGLTSCHTALAGGYVVVGHVPADALQRLLAERPPIAGISVPGMPQSAPGMDGSTRDHYDVVAFDRDRHTGVYERR